MGYKVGDKVRIKDIDWYNENKDEDGLVEFEFHIFVPGMSKFCGKVLTVADVYTNFYGCETYSMKEDDYEWGWGVDMIEGLVERNGKTYPYKIGDRVVLKGNNRCATITDLKYNSWGNLSYYIKIDNDKDISIDYPTDLLLPYDNKVEGYVEKENENKLKLDSTKTVREYWSEYSRIFIEIYVDEPNECVFTHLYTIEGHRQKGYGRRALSEAEEIAKELGCNVAYLKVETDSWIHQWYLRMGYKWYKNINSEYTWLAKNLTDIEKKPKYPKTSDECRAINGCEN